MSDSIFNLNIYTDGAHSSKTNVGGWAIIIRQNEAPEENYTFYRDWSFDTTNNRMELTAVAKALSYIYNKCRYEPFNSQFEGAIIYTDSSYISNAFKDKWFNTWRANGWRTSKRTPVLNQDLWEEILYYYEQLPNITITRVSGHSGNKWNELADKLAVEARITGAKFIQESENNNVKQ